VESGGGFDAFHSVECVLRSGKEKLLAGEAVINVVAKWLFAIDREGGMPMGGWWDVFETNKFGIKNSESR
jgi:hypothetical protein